MLLQDRFGNISAKIKENKLLIAAALLSMLLILGIAPTGSTPFSPAKIFANCGEEDAGAAGATAGTQTMDATAMKISPYYEECRRQSEQKIGQDIQQQDAICMEEFPNSPDYCEEEINKWAEKAVDSLTCVCVANAENKSTAGCSPVPDKPFGGPDQTDPINPPPEEQNPWGA